METRAHFIVIGLFTILGIIGGLAFFIWLASVQIDRQYTQYGVLFNDVSGLDQSADVLFNGVSVGRVVDIRIWEEDPGLVYVGIEIDSDTPVRVDTIAQLETQGVTGVAYIALSGGSRDAARLNGSVAQPPIIASRRSTMQSLVNSAPDILADAAQLVEQLQEITGPENRAYVRSILQNVDAATAELDAALADFSDIARTVSDATAQITVFTDRLDEIGASVQSTLASADGTLASVAKTFEDADAVIAAMKPAVENADAAFASMDAFITDDLSPLTDTVTTTLANTDTALASADQAFVSADRIMANDLGPVLTDLRTALTQITEATSTITADAPAIIADIRNIVADVQNAVTAAAPGMRDFGQLGGEARALVRSINALVRDIARDPARFFLDNRVPDYRR